MHCPNCGETVNKKLRFCKSCGERLSKADELRLTGCGIWHLLHASSPGSQTGGWMPGSRLTTWKGNMVNGYG